jgi:signal peptidase
MTLGRVLGAVRRLGAFVAVVALTAALVAVWPARFGGATRFVVVRGESMEPTYHSGDLIYARSAGDFAPGEIAVYRQPEADGSGTSLVIHRIVDHLDDGRYVFQGDNRDYPDDTRPTAEDIVARPIANLGPLPTEILFRLPLILALVIGATFTWYLWPRDESAEAAPDPVGSIPDQRPMPVTLNRSFPSGRTTRKPEPVGMRTSAVTRRAPTTRWSDGASTTPTSVTSRTSTTSDEADRLPVSATMTSTASKRASTSASIRRSSAAALMTRTETESELEAPDPEAGQ